MYDVTDTKYRIVEKIKRCSCKDHATRPFATYLYEEASLMGFKVIYMHGAFLSPGKFVPWCE